MHKRVTVLAATHVAYAAATAAEAADATADATALLTSIAPLDTNALAEVRALPHFVTIYITAEFVGIRHTPKLVCGGWV